MRLNLPAQSPTGCPSRVWATGPLSCCLRCNQNCPCWLNWSEFILSEQLFLRGCLKVCLGIFDPLTTTSSSTLTAVRRDLFDRYRDLVASVAVNVHSLIESDSCHSLNIGLIRWIDDYVHIWQEYGRALCDATVVHAMTLSKTENGLVNPELIQQLGGVGRSGGEILTAVMNEPLSRMTDYVQHLDKFVEAHRHRNDDPSVDDYKRASHLCAEVAAGLALDCQSAEQTRSFWDSCSVKLSGNQSKFTFQTEVIHFFFEIRRSEDAGAAFDPRIADPSHHVGQFRSFLFALVHHSDGCAGPRHRLFQPRHVPVDNDLGRTDARR